MIETPNFYAILTPDVRYSSEISANEKLLFAEVTALLTMRNECFASNNYFASLFGVTPQAISKWLKNLEKNGFIFMEYIYKKGSKEIEKRYIKVSTNIDRGINNGIKGINNSLGGINRRLKISNTNLSTTLTNKTISVLPDWLDINAWNDWVEFRKEIKKKLTPKSIEKQLEFLELHKQVHVEIIRKSIQGGWTGLYELKNDFKKSDLHNRCINEGQKDYSEENNQSF